MKKNQKINCNVESCEYNDCNCHECNLKEIEISCDCGCNNDDVKHQSETVCSNFKANKKQDN